MGWRQIASFQNISWIQDFRIFDYLLLKRRHSEVYFFRLGFSSFLGIKNNARLCKVYVPKKNLVWKVRFADFHNLKGNTVPSLKALLQGLFRNQALNLDQKLDEEAETTS